MPTKMLVFFSQILIKLGEGMLWTMI